MGDHYVFSKLPYRRTIVLLLILLVAASWQVYAGWAPLLSWTIMVLAQVALMGLLLYGSRARLPVSRTTPTTPEAQHAAVSQAIAAANENTDASGSPTPRLPAGLRNLVPGIKPTALAAQVRAYASVEDARSYGWDFDSEIGTFNGSPIFQWANLEGARWEYDGLTAANFNPSVPSNRRIFGRLRYREIEESPSDPTTIDASATTQAGRSASVPASPPPGGVAANPA